jgi:hypothetical protein
LPVSYVTKAVPLEQPERTRHLSGTYHKIIVLAVRSAILEQQKAYLRQLKRQARDGLGRD